jgi:hypothetical protein
MDVVFAWIEQTPLSIWMREDFYAYFIVLIFHSIGMGLLVGGGLAVSLRTMGFAKGAALEKFRGFFPVMWTGVVMAAISGIFLLIGYPAKALTNPIFAFKFVCLIAAGVMIREIVRRLFPIAASGAALPDSARWMGLAAALLWVGGIAGGKLLLYTYSVLTVS